MVLNDHRRVSGGYQALQDVQQGGYITERKAGSRLIQNVECPAGSPPRQFRGQLYSLRFAAGESGRRLADMKISQAYVVQGGQFVFYPGDIFEEGERLLHRHIKHFGDVFAFEAHFQRLAIITFPFANFTGYGYIGQELHLNLDIAFPPAGLTASAFDVEREAAGSVAPHPGFRDGGKKFPDGGEGAGIRGRVAPRRATDGRLVNVNDFINMLQAGNFITVTGFLPRTVEYMGQFPVKNLIDEGALTAAGYAGDTDKLAQGEAYIDVFQVILPGALYPDFFTGTGTPGVRQWNPFCPVEILAGYRVPTTGDIFQSPGNNNPAAVFPGSGAHIDNMVGGSHHGFVMLDDQQRITQVSQTLHGSDEAGVISGMETDRRFVTDVEHPHQPAAYLGGQANPLRFAAAECGRSPVNRQVFQADVLQKAETGLNLFHNLLGNHPLALTEYVITGSGHPFQELSHREGADRHNITPADSHCQGFRFQPFPLTYRAGTGGHVALDLRPGVLRFCIAVKALHAGYYPFKAFGIFPDSPEAIPVVV